MNEDSKTNWAQMDALEEDAIDTSDTPPLSDAFFDRAKWQMLRGSGMDAPKYALPEIERRMLVDAAQLPDLRGLPCRHITDRYLEAGRLRLRRVTNEAEVEVVYKLCKKYGGTGAYEEPIVNIYLTAQEYDALRVLPGCDLVKRRYTYDYAGRRFSIDAHTGTLAGLYLCECEAASVSELLAVTFPPFAVRDVTANPNYSGLHLARCQQSPDTILPVCL